MSNQPALYRIDFVTDPDGRVLLADIDIVEPVTTFAWVEGDQHGEDGGAIRFPSGLGKSGFYGIVLLASMEAVDEQG